ncbi:MAG: hypothetical protein K2Q22_01800, partial [Cytophagales bacterium]|nr:hypothetical protein [Cytophagales bacterium]
MMVDFQKVYSQCTGCSSTISTNVNGGFTANGQTICITSSTYSSNFDFGGGTYSNTTLCVASNVNWSGNTFTQAGNPTTINLYGTSSYNLTGWSGLTNGLTFNVKQGAVQTGNVTFNIGSQVNVDGIFNSIGSNMNNGGGSFYVSSTGVATIPGGTVGVTFNNQGTMYSPNTTTFNQPTTLSGTVIINGTAAYNSTLLIGGNVTIRGDFAINSLNLTVLPNATLSVTGNVSINSAGQTNLAGNIIIDGTFTQNNGTLNQSGSFQVGGLVTLIGNTTLSGTNSFGSLTQNGGTITQGSGSTQVTGNVLQNGNITGGGGGCGLFCPGGTWTNNGTVSAGTGLSVCKSPTGNSVGSGVGVFIATTTSQPTGLTISATTSGYAGIFTIATNTGTSGYMVVRNAGSQPAAPASFTNYSVGSVVSGTTIVVAIISPRTVSSFIDIQPSTCGAQYFYGMYAYQISTSTGTACGNMFYMNTLNPATANFTTSSLGSTNSITGSSTACSSSSGVYTTASVVGASGYLWSYGGSGVTITSTTTSATLVFGSAATGGTLTVYAFSGCATATGSILAISLSTSPTILS